MFNMTDQERSAAREALAQFYSIPSTSSANYPFAESSIAVMHAVLKKHEADFRKRIADDVKSLLPALGDYKRGLNDALAIVKPPEPRFKPGDSVNDKNMNQFIVYADDGGDFVYVVPIGKAMPGVGIGMLRDVILAAAESTR
jgi:hypothetical protein